MFARKPPKPYETIGPLASVIAGIFCAIPGVLLAWFFSGLGAVDVGASTAYFGVIILAVSSSIRESLRH